MAKQNKHHCGATIKRTKYSLTPVLFVVFALFLSLFSFSPLLQQRANAVTSGTINFQARLLNASGAVVPDGTYNVQFNLYTVASGGSTQWTETYLNNATQGVTVKAGYFSVNLGSLTSLPSTIQWDQEQWLGMTVRGTGSCSFGACSPTDSEMTPRFKLTAVPYALSAGQLQTSSGGFTSKLVVAAPTADRTITAPDASGTICLTSGNCAGVGGTGDILQGGNSFGAAVTIGTNDSFGLNLETGGSTVASFGSTGNLTLQSTANASGAFRVLNAAGTTTVLNVDTTSGVVSVGGPGDCGSASSRTCIGPSYIEFNAVGGNVTPRISQGDNAQLNFGTGSSGQYRGVRIQGPSVGVETSGYSSLTVAGSASQTGNILNVVNSSATTVFSIGTAGAIVAKNSTNSTTAFQVQPSGSATPVLNVDTTNSRVGIGTASPSAPLEIVNGSSYTRFDAPGLSYYNFAYNKTASVNLNYALEISTSDYVEIRDNSANVLAGFGVVGLHPGLSLNSRSTSQPLQVNKARASQTADLLQFQDSTSNINASFSATGAQLTLGRIAASGTLTQGVLRLSDGTTSNVALSLQSSTLTASRTATFPDATGTVCLTTGNCSGVGGTGDILNNGQNGTVRIGSNDANSTILESNGVDRLTIDSTGLSTFAGSVALAASQYLSISGGNTASRPASPTEGMVYFDTTTDQLITYANGKWQQDRTEAILVAASNSSQSDKDAADYVADGNTGTANDGDQIQINNALTAASGRKVVLLAGTYVADATILVPNNTTLAGVGDGTLIELADIDIADNLIENTDTTTGTGVVIQDLKLNGRKDLNSVSLQYGIYFNGMGGSSGDTTRQGGKIINVTSSNFNYYAFYLNASKHSTISGSTAIDNSIGFYLNSTSDTVLTDNKAQGNSGQGFQLLSSSSNTLQGNIAEDGASGQAFNISGSSNNNFTGNYAINSGIGFYVTSSSFANTFASNHARSNSSDGFSINSDRNTLTGNSSVSNSVGFGIGSSYNVVSGNTSQTNTTNFMINGSSYNSITGNSSYNSSNPGFYILSSSNFNTISGNFAIGTTGAGNFYLSSSNGNIVSNNSSINSYGNNFNDGIILSASDNNSITGNTITDNSCTSICYAINISNSTSDNNFIADNTYRVSAGTVQPTIQDLGTGTRYASQLTPSQILQSGSSLLRANASNTLTGTGAIAGTTAVTGTSTKFTTELQVGDRITLNSQTRTVTVITSDTALTVDTAFTGTVSAQTITRLPAALRVASSAGVTQLVVADNGFVGIGTSSPQDLLTLEAEDPYIRFNMGSVSTDLGGLQFYKGGVNQAFIGYSNGIALNSIVGGVDVNAASGSVVSLNISGSSANPTFTVGGADLVYENNNVDQLRISTTRTYLNGNLGIGDLTPDARLDVVGSSDQVQLIVEANATQTNNIVEIKNASGLTATTIDGTGALLTVGNLVGSLGSVRLTDGATYYSTIAPTVASLTANRTLTIPDVSGTICTTANNCTGLGAYIQNGTSAQNNANFNIQSTGTTNVTAKLRANTSQTADILQVRDSSDTTTLLSIAADGTLSVPGSGTGSERFGASSSTGIYNNALALGNGATATGAGGIAIGQGATSSGISLGVGATGSGISIGSGAYSNTGSVAINASANNNNVFVVGGVTSVYFGDGGVGGTAPAAVSLQSTGSTSTAAPGSDFTIRAGAGSGSSNGSAGGNLTLSGANGGGGNLGRAGGSATLQGGNAGGVSGSAVGGNVSIQGGTGINGGAAGEITIATTMASALILGRTGFTTSNNGSLTVAENLTVDTNTLFVDATNNRVGFGTITPGARLDVVQSAQTAAEGIRVSQGGNSIQLYNSTSNNSYFEFSAGSGYITNSNGNGNIFITTPRAIGLTTNSANLGDITLNAGNIGNSLLFQTNTLTRLEVDDSGNVIADTNTLFVDATNNRVGILNAAPANTLSVNTLTTADSVAQLAISTGATTNKGITVQAVAAQTAPLLDFQSSTGTTILRVTGAGDIETNQAGLSICHTTGCGVDYLFVGDSVTQQSAAIAGRGFIFSNGSEYARFDAANAGLVIGDTSASAKLEVNSAGTTIAAIINNGASTGNILNLQDNGTNVLTVADGGAVLIGQNTTNDTLTVGAGTGNATIDIYAGVNGTAALNLTSDNGSGDRSQINFKIADYPSYAISLDLDGGTVLTQNQTISIPNASGTLCLTSGNCAGIGGTGDILNNGQNGTVRIGSNDASSTILESNGTDRLTIDSTGTAVFSDRLYVGTGSSATSCNTISGYSVGCAAKFGVYQNANTATSNVQINTDSTLLVNAPSSSSAAYMVQANYVDTTGTNNYTNASTVLNNYNWHSGSGTLASATGVYNNVASIGGGTVTNAYGTYNVLDSRNAGSVLVNGYGTYNEVYSAIGSSTNLVGSYNEVGIYGAASTTTTVGSDTLISLSSSGNITSAFGSRILTAVDLGAGSIISLSGIAVEEQSAATNNTNLLVGTSTIPTGQYSIYNSSTDDNYFAGRLGVGVVPSVANSNLEIGNTGGNTAVELRPSAGGLATLTFNSQIGDNLVIEADDTNETLRMTANGTDLVLNFAGATINRSLAVDTNTLYVDDSGDRVGIGNTGSTGKLSVSGATSALILAESTGSNNAYITVKAPASQQAGLLFNTNNTDRYQLGVQTDNSFFLYDNASSRNAFTITSGSLNLQPSAGDVVLGAIDATASLLILDTKNTVGDPTGVAGGMYYNGNLGLFRCFTTVWIDCAGGSSKWVDGGAFTYLGNTGDELVVGASTGQANAVKLSVVSTNSTNNAITLNTRATLTNTAAVSQAYNTWFNTDINPASAVSTGVGYKGSQFSMYAQGGGNFNTDTYFGNLEVYTEIGNGTTDSVGTVSGLSVTGQFGTNMSVDTYRGIGVFNPTDNGTLNNAAGLVVNNFDAGANNVNLLIGQTGNPSGNWSIYNNSTYNNLFGGNIVGNSVSGTPNLGNTEGTARTNVTTVTIDTGVGSFANNDVIFINNAGQDYYTRITAGGGTTSMTVSPAVSYDANANITEYTYQNIGRRDYTSANLGDRFFEGYFLGGIVTGAGSTTLSDQNLSSTGALVVSTAGTARLSINSAGESGFGTAGVTGRTLTVNGVISATAGNRLQLVSSSNSNLWNLDNNAGTLRIFREDFAATGTGANGAVRLSLSDTGNATLSGAITVANGSATAPSLNFASATTYGLGYVNSADGGLPWSNGPVLTGGTGWAYYSQTAGSYRMGFRGNGGNSIRYLWSADNAVIGEQPNDASVTHTLNVMGTLKTTGQAVVGSGTSCNNVQLAFSTTDTDTGLCWVSDGTMRWMANNLDTLSLQASGFVNIGGGDANGTGSSANLTVNGRVADCTIGSGTAATSCSSDSRLKNSITSTTNNLWKIDQLNPVTYKWNSDVSGRVRQGLIAQEVLPYFPEAVDTLNDGYYALDYASLVSPLIGAVKELKVITDSLNARLSVVEAGQFSGSITVANDATISDDLRVLGDTTVEKLTVNGKIITAGTAPTVQPATASGFNAAVVLAGNDTAGTVSYTSGTVDLPSYNVTTGEQFSATFSSPYTAAPRIALTAKNEQSASVRYFVQTTTTGFTVRFIDAPTQNTEYNFDYIIVQ